MEGENEEEEPSFATTKTNKSKTKSGFTTKPQGYWSNDKGNNNYNNKTINYNNYNNDEMIVINNYYKKERI